MSIGNPPRSIETRPPTPRWVKALAAAAAVLVLALVITRLGGLQHGPGMHDAPMATHGPGMHDTPQPTGA
jgi:hypothetical protein